MRSKITEREWTVCKGLRMSETLVVLRVRLSQVRCFQEKMETVCCLEKMAHEKVFVTGGQGVQHL